MSDLDRMEPAGMAGNRALETLSRSEPPQPRQASFSATAKERIVIVIADQVNRIMRHYWMADESEQSRQSQVEDWIIDLRQYPEDIVRAAFEEWRHLPGGRRPTPGDVRSICSRELYRRQERERDAANARPPYPTDITEKRRWLAERGIHSQSDLDRERRRLGYAVAERHAQR